MFCGFLAIIVSDERLETDVGIIDESGGGWNDLSRSLSNVNTGVFKAADFLVPQDNRNQMDSSSDPYGGPDSLKVDTQ